jgi:hypothetical protein
MNVEFNISVMSNQEKSLMHSFLYVLLNDIKNGVKNNIIAPKMNIREDNLLNLTYIDWVNNKPSHIDMVSLAFLIANSIVCVRLRDNIYSIEISRRINMPHTRTRLYKIAKFLNFGDEYTMPTLFISSVFYKYSKNINRYWKSFVSLKLGRIETHECILIR